MIVISDGELYNPQYQGKMDVLVGGKEIIAIERSLNIQGLDYEVLDAKDCYVTPGFIDSHVHICGGGGEGGYHTRTPEINLTDIIIAGVSTVVGVLGTDGTTRTMTNLLAKAYALETEGVSTYTYTGSYQIPVRTLSGNITDDLILVEKIIGAGEIALSDHRSSCPGVEELTRLVSEARLGGMLSGKAGVVNIHMGDADAPLKILDEVLSYSNIPITQFYPTHINRNKKILNDSVEFAKKGGYLDLTTATTPQFLKNGEISSAKALKYLLEQGVPMSNITASSDGQGSLPVFDETGNLTELKVATSFSLLEYLKEAVGEGIPIEIILSTLTSNVSKILKLSRKGHLHIGMDADILILEKETLEIRHLVCKGKVMVKDGHPISFGTFHAHLKY